MIHAQPFVATLADQNEQQLTLALKTREGMKILPKDFDKVNGGTFRRTGKNEN